MFTNFISNISYDVTKECLYDLLIQITPIKALSYKTKIAFVDYYNEEDQNKSLFILNLTQLYDRRIIIEKIENKTYIKIECSINADVYYIKDIFTKFGSCEIQSSYKDTDKRSAGSEFICIYRKKEEANKALKEMNNKNILSRKFQLELILNRNY